MGRAHRALPCLFEEWELFATVRWRWRGSVGRPGPPQEGEKEEATEEVQGDHHQRHRRDCTHTL